ncbi:ATP-binding cassette domain-containing protein [Herbidospora mongoliensis]|uniref:ATP-binding cassette domain-containing protein n=1 Tax=Herbidospora mongoliensis TaxID=688067 RepID=UPI0008351EFF|nr:ATP-binding cassette domain-containing protein [Herbidospora mongoliensis]
MIHARGLTKTYKLKKTTVDAVRGVDLDVEPGQLVAFLGPNGAGKSTCLRMLTGLLPPTSGTARVAGHDITTEQTAVRSRIGYIGQKNGAGETFRIGDELVTQGRCHGMPRREAKARAEELLTVVGLDGLFARKPSTLSGGQRRRLDIALGLMNRPPLLFLDEPSTGLDPASRADIWSHILQLRADHGMTLFLTTHYLDEADAMAERVIVIDQGRIIADGTARQLKSDLAGDRLTVTLHDAADIPRAAELAGGLPGAADITSDGPRLTLRVAAADRALPEYVRVLDAAGLKLDTAESSRPTLDDVFLALTGRTIREEDA